MDEIVERPWMGLQRASEVPARIACCKQFKTMKVNATISEVKINTAKCYKSKMPAPSFQGQNTFVQNDFAFDFRVIPVRSNRRE
jgi:hypothetical protein